MRKSKQNDAGYSGQDPKNDLPTVVTETLLTYDEAKASGCGGKDLLGAESVAAEHRERLEKSLSCLDLLYQV